MYNSTRRQQREFAESKNFCDWVKPVAKAEGILKNASRNIFIIRAEQRQPLRLKNIFQKNFKKHLTNSQRCAIIRVSKARGSRQGIFENLKTRARSLYYTRANSDRKFFQKNSKNPLTKSRTCDIIKVS